MFDDLTLNNLILNNVDNDLEVAIRIKRVGSATDALLGAPFAALVIQHDDAVAAFEARVQVQRHVRWLVALLQVDGESDISRETWKMLMRSEPVRMTHTSTILSQALNYFGTFNSGK